MRHTELWALLDEALGSAYARSWAAQQSITGLGSRTVVEALDAGVAPKQVWAEVRQHLGLTDPWR